MLAAAAAAAAPGAAGARTSILYDEQPAVRALTAPGGPGAPIDAARGALRQDPGVGGIFDPQGRNAAFRVAKLSARELAPLSAESMAARIRREIDHPEHANTSGLVAIDEIGNAFNDGRARITYRWRTVRGTRIRVASYNRLVVTRHGWRLERGTAPLPAIKPGSPGAKLSRAIAILAATPHPAGGSYAQRVNLYVAPAFGSSIAAGRGEHHNLGNDGKPHRATWRGVMPALAAAGGVWLEMYHHSSATGLGSMTAREWRTVPGTFSSYLARFGGDPGRLHLMIGRAAARPAGAPASCGGPQACQWALAASTPAGRALLANGPGAYLLGDQATAWRMEYNRALPGT
jgi:hypothetical protein